MSKRTLMVVLTTFIAAAIFYVTITSEDQRFEDVCQPSHNHYSTLCEHVGKRAFIHNTISYNNIIERDLGSIIGISWRPKGSVISAPKRQKRYAPEDAHYYIIGSDKSEYQFLKATDDVILRESPTPKPAYDPLD